MQKTYYRLRQISTGLYCTGVSGPGWSKDGMYFKSVGAVSRAIGSLNTTDQFQLGWLTRAKRDNYDTLKPGMEEKILAQVALNVPENMEIVPYDLVEGLGWPVGQKPPKKRA